MALPTIPIARPSLTKKERKNVIDAFDSGYISASGDYIDKFEEAFGAYHNMDYAISCDSGTSALHLALACLGIGRDCEVIIPSLTFIATKNAVLYQKAVPIAVDIDPETLTIDVNKVEEQINRRTKAIIAVHLYGNPCKMEELLKICTKHRIHLIEDCAESLGSKYGDKLCGTFGTLSCFSFYGNKTVTTGQGGMVLTPSLALDDMIRRIKNQAMVYPYHHNGIGYNYRMTNIEAAIGLAQMGRIDEILSKKRFISDCFKNNIRGTFIKSQEKSDPIWWMNTLEMKDQEDANGLREHLYKLGIETRPCFESMELYKRVAEDKAKRIVCLPSGPEISKKELNRIVEGVNGYNGPNR